MRNVIFDIGNVVVRWRPFLALDHIFADEAEMERAFAEIGFYDWNLEQDRGRSWADGIAHAERETPAHAHVFRGYADGLGPAHRERVAGTSELIEALHARGVALYALTNAALASFEAAKAAAPALGLMRDVLVSAVEGVVKPDPAIFELCLSRNGLDRSETLFVDDSARNCEAAEALGITAHRFTTADDLASTLRALRLL